MHRPDVSLSDLSSHQRSYLLDESPPLYPLMPMMACEDRFWGAIWQHPKKCHLTTESCLVNIWMASFFFWHHGLQKENLDHILANCLANETGSCSVDLTQNILWWKDLALGHLTVSLSFKNQLINKVNIFETSRQKQPVNPFGSHLAQIQFTLWRNEFSQANKFYFLRRSMSTQRNLVEIERNN